jgi:hypothetical protein
MAEQRPESPERHGEDLAYDLSGQDPLDHSAEEGA